MLEKNVYSAAIELRHISQVLLADGCFSVVLSLLLVASGLQF